MMNVPIILYTASETHDDALRELALTHCRTSARYLVRDDGGTVHEAIFDPHTGEYLRQNTQQGWSAESAWSRGVAWGLYGFGTVFHQTQDLDFLATAERIADFYVSHTPSGAIPFWDFTAEEIAGAPRHVDSSAAAIAASGLWNLSLLTHSPQRRELYHEHALRTLCHLCSSDYLAKGHPDQEGILLHGVYHLPKGLGVDESVSWGDHFFVEGLVKGLSNARTLDI